MPVDIAILKFFNITLASPVFDVFFKSIDNFNIWRWPLAAAIVLLLWKGGPKGRWLVLSGIIAAAIIDPAIHLVLKPLFARPRPCHDAALSWIRLTVGCGGRYGFPSSHAANFLGQAVVIGAFYRSSRYYMYPIAVLVSLGRIYLGVHYPSDVLGGAIFGVLVGLAVIIGMKRFAPRGAGMHLVLKQKAKGS